MTTNQAAREAAAKAICIEDDCRWPGADDPLGYLYMRQADAAIDAFLSALGETVEAPAGWARAKDLDFAAGGHTAFWVSAEQSATYDTAVYSAAALAALQARVEQVERELRRATDPAYLETALNKIGVVDAEWKLRAEALQAKLDKCREALRPFGDLAADYLADTVNFDDETIMAGRITRRGEESTPPRVTFGDFRRARSLSNAEGAGDGNE